MKFFSTATVTSGLLLTARGQYTPLTYCNVDTNMNWVLMNHPVSFNHYDTSILDVVPPAYCQTVTYGKDYYYSFRYHVCNITGDIDYSDPNSKCSPPARGGFYGSYLGDLNISIHITYAGNTLQANFTPHVVSVENMTESTCQIHPSYYNIYINTTENMLPCVLTDDDPLADDEPSDDSTDNQNSKEKYTLTTQDKIVIGVLVPAFVFFCVALYLKRNERSSPPSSSGFYSPRTKSPIATLYDDGSIGPPEVRI